MQLRLSQLQPKFLQIISETHWKETDDLQSAQGIQFLCPKCFWENGCSDIGVHSVVCWFKDRGVPDTVHPLPGRWNPHGTGYDDLSFVGPGANSILLTAGCRWHGFIRCGEVTEC